MYGRPCPSISTQSCSWKDIGASSNMIISLLEKLQLKPMALFLRDHFQRGQKKLRYIP